MPLLKGTLVGKELTLWPPDVAQLRVRATEDLSLFLKHMGFSRVVTPNIVTSTLYNTYKDRMYLRHAALSQDHEHEETWVFGASKTLCHIQLQEDFSKSYRDLPLKFFEFGELYENDGTQPSNCFGVTLSIFGTDERDEEQLMIPVLLGLQDLAKSMGFTAAKKEGDRLHRPHQHITFIDDTYTTEENTKAPVHLTYVDCKLWLIENDLVLQQKTGYDVGQKGESDVERTTEDQSAAGPEGGEQPPEGRLAGDPG